jgi:hypothetical protein
MFVAQLALKMGVLARTAATKQLTLSPGGGNDHAGEG